MIINKAPFLYWYRTKCFIENKRIQEIDYHNRIAYIIKDAPSLLQDFIKIDINNEETIIDFVNNYGFLTHEFAGDKVKIGTLSSKGFKSTYSESVDSFKERVAEFKMLLILHKVYTSDEPVSVLLNPNNAISWHYRILSELRQRTRGYLDIKTENSVIKSIAIKEQDYFEGMEYSTSIIHSEKDLKSVASDILTRIINEGIKDICPMLKLNNEFNEINSTWKTRSLLEILYLKYYETISNGEELRRCANEKCNKEKYFPVRIDKVKRYCCNECAFQGMQNDAYREIRNPNSNKYSPAKAKFQEVYGKLYYLDSYNRIDREIFKKWSKKARKKLKDINNDTIKQSGFIEWLGVLEEAHKQAKEGKITYKKLEEIITILTRELEVEYNGKYQEKK